MATKKLIAVCKICGESAPHHKSATAKSGHQYSCIYCHRRDVSEWQRWNKDMIDAARARREKAKQEARK